jgi:hypothetical protein
MQEGAEQEVMSAQPQVSPAEHVSAAHARYKCMRSRRVLTRRETSTSSPPFPSASSSMTMSRSRSPSAGKMPNVAGNV